jgi:hypothetical protein
MSNTPLTGPAGNWDRQRKDVFAPADVDGDGQTEIVIFNNFNDDPNNPDCWTGVLKWQGGALVPIWMTNTSLTGPVNWDRAPGDEFIVADVDGDGQAEILLANTGFLTTGILKWQDGALVPIWASGTPLPGPAGKWDRGSLDGFYALDINGDGRQEIVIYNPEGPFGVLAWEGGALVPIFKSPGAGWHRRWDRFTFADVDGDRQEETAIYHDGSFGGATQVVKWINGALTPIWAQDSPLTGPGGSWTRGDDRFPAADLDGDGQVELVIWAAEDYGNTGVLKWQDGALQLIWMKGYPLSGPAGDWDRGPEDVFVAADVDGDLHQEIVIFNNNLDHPDLYTGVLKWNP